MRRSLRHDIGTASRNFAEYAPKLLPVALCLATPFLRSQTPADPGVRGGTAGAGAVIAGVTVQQGKFFNAGQATFTETDSVTGSISGTGKGLGPRFNMDSCAGCHAQPAAGGTSPAVNPQVAVATKNAATNSLPYFVTSNGPVREARFKYADSPTNQVRDGGVHDIFTISGRTDASGCVLQQPDFNTASAQNNISLRIPTPVFGGGLIEGIPDETILQNKGQNAAAKAAMGIAGHENREGNTGTITRFGWKAQNKSLAVFAGEAYNVEQGVTNDLFPDEREQAAGCLYNGTPEDLTQYSQTQPQSVASDVVNFTNFMRFLAPPAPACGPGTRTCSSSIVASVSNGEALFTSNSVGCALCHTPSLQTGASSSAALSNQTAALFSDLLVHHMGSNLADDIIQGSAGPDEFRTAPLWGLGQRIFFLHDGRTSDLIQAILAHASAGSEANGSIAAFNSLTAQQQQDILNFLRSL